MLPEESFAGGINGSGVALGPGRSVFVGYGSKIGLEIIVMVGPGVTWIALFMGEGIG